MPMPMNSPSAPHTSTTTDRELDQALSSGPLRDIVIPSCPELLLALRAEMDQADPDPHVIAEIAGRDVAMAASLIRTANSPFYARANAVNSVSQALNLLGVRPSERLLTTFLMRNAVRISSPLWSTSGKPPPDAPWPWPTLPGSSTA